MSSQNRGTMVRNQLRQTMEPKNYGTKKQWNIIPLPKTMEPKIKPWNQNKTMVRNQLRQTVEPKNHGT